MGYVRRVFRVPAAYFFGEGRGCRGRSEVRRPREEPVVDVEDPTSSVRTYDPDVDEEAIPKGLSDLVESGMMMTAAEFAEPKAYGERGKGGDTSVGCVNEGVVGLDSVVRAAALVLRRAELESQGDQLKGSCGLLREQSRKECPPVLPCGSSWGQGIDELRDIHRGRVTLTGICAGGPRWIRRGKVDVW